MTTTTQTTKRTHKIEVTRKTLLVCLAEAKRFADSHSAMPIIGTVSLTLEGDRLRVWATDLNLSVSEHLPTVYIRDALEGNQSKLSSQVGVCADAAKLHDVVKALEDATVTLEIEETHTIDTITLEKGRRCVEEPSHKEVVFDETRRTCGKQLPNARLACCGALSATYTETRETLAFAVITKKSRYKLGKRLRLLGQAR